MRVFSFLFCFMLLVLSCNKKVSYGDDGISVPCKTVIISSSIFQDLNPNQVTVTELSIADDCIIATLGFGGCNADHEMKMISDGSIAESLPPQITFDFKDGNPQDCKAYFEVEHQFDLSPIRELIEDDIIIRFRNSDISVLYKK